MTAPAPLLSLEHVTVLRGAREQRPALEDVTLEIGAGEHVCILGPNGCGKSTLIKTITRECYPQAREGSSISILGRERWNIFELRSKLGIVSPDLLASCTTDATGRDVVLSGFFSSTRIFPHHHPDPEHVRRAREALARLGIAHLAERAVAEMSSGEAKRALIARALVHEPQTLLFDEPSNALDIAAQLQLRNTMRELAHRVSKLQLGRDVQRVARLIEKQRLGLMHQRSRDQCPLRLARGHLGDRALRQMRNSQPRKSLPRSPNMLGVGMVMRKDSRAAEKSRKDYVPSGRVRGARRQQIRRYNSQLRAQFENVPSLAPQNGNRRPFARLRITLTRDGLDQRGLPAPIRSQDAHVLPSPDFQRDVFQGRPLFPRAAQHSDMFQGKQWSRSRHVRCKSQTSS